jgi:hypothetical protein
MDWRGSARDISNGYLYSGEYSLIKERTMFFCEECRVKNNWPGIIEASYGPCEVCGKTAECYDVPSSRLPEPKKESTYIDSNGKVQIKGEK